MTIRGGAELAAAERASTDLEAIFNREFRADFNTVLEGGADEPLYLPAGRDSTHHRLIYREDFFSSALHEISHWCIAGEARRHRVDFGYWYEPDGRTAQQQRAFERAEVKPQALEWIFSNAAGVPFNVSADNLAAGETASAGPSAWFLHAIERQAQAYCLRGLPPRAARFAGALGAVYSTPDHTNHRLYRGRLSP